MCPSTKDRGCFECGGTGFRGRTAIHELLDLSERIREMILMQAANVGSETAGERRGHDVPAGIGHR